MALPCPSGEVTGQSSVTSDPVTAWTAASVHGVLQAGTLEWWPFPSPDLPEPGVEPGSPASQADSLPAEPPRKPMVGVRQAHKAFRPQRGQGRDSAALGCFGFKKNNSCFTPPHAPLVFLFFFGGGPFLKWFLNLLQCGFCLRFWVFGHRVPSLPPDQGSACTGR